MYMNITKILEFPTGISSFEDAPALKANAFIKAMFTFAHWRFNMPRSAP